MAHNKYFCEENQLTESTSQREQKMDTRTQIKQVMKAFAQQLLTYAMHHEHGNLYWTKTKYMTI